MPASMCRFEALSAPQESGSAPVRRGSEGALEVAKIQLRQTTALYDLEGERPVAK